jgi:glutamine synthetase
VLAAGLDGLERQLDPGPYSLEDLHAAPPTHGRGLPRSQGEALTALGADGVLREALGEAFCQAYERMLPQRSGPSPLHLDQARSAKWEQT